MKTLKSYCFNTILYITEYLQDCMLGIKYFFSGSIRKLRRMIYWGWRLRNSEDFCADSLYYVMYLKLDRVYNCMLSDSHLVWNSDKNTVGMRKLREAVELCKRLSEYPEKETPLTVFMGKYRSEESSWGDLYFRKDRKPLPKKLYRFFFKKARVKEENELKYMKRRLFFLLDRHLEGWWD